MNIKTLSLLTAVGVGLLGGCASGRHAASAPQSRIPGDPNPTIGYDDRQIAKIQRGETAEAQLLQWFGVPDTREVKPDGRTQLSWSSLRRTDGGRGQFGMVAVSLSPDGKVEAYSARGGPLQENRTVDVVEKSEADMREHMEQWRREGWRVLSVSARLPQADGTSHRKVELSRSHGGDASSFGYDDRQIAKVQRGTTTQAQLLEWFGPAYSRDLKPDGRAQLAWNFASRTDGDSGELRVSLASDGLVDAYSARRGPR